MYDHSDNQSGPGTEWNPENKKPIGRVYVTTVDNLLFLDNYHLFVKCAYAQSYHEQTSELESWTGLYNKMQIKRIGFSKLEKFDGLIKSIQENGFDENCPIPVSTEYKILDGSHRLAASFACHVNPSVQMYENSSHSYGRDWFESVNFTNNELTTIDLFKDEIAKSYSTSDVRIAIVWGSALAYWNEIISSVNAANLSTAFQLELENEINVRAFVHKSYEGDGASAEMIANKAVYLSNFGTRVGIIALRNLSQELTLSYKKLIRESISKKMDNYVFDNIIHVVDCPMISKEIISKYFLPTVCRV